MSFVKYTTGVSCLPLLFPLHPHNIIGSDSSVAIITLLNANPFIFIIVLKKFISVLGLQIQTTR